LLFLALAGMSETRRGPDAKTSHGEGRSDLCKRASRAALVADRSGCGGGDLLLNGRRVEGSKPGRGFVSSPAR